MGALVASAMVGNADTMAELGSVPLGPCHGPWSERRQWMVGRAPESDFSHPSSLYNSCGCNEPTAVLSASPVTASAVCISYLILDTSELCHQTMMSSDPWPNAARSSAAMGSTAECGP